MEFSYFDCDPIEFTEEQYNYLLNKVKEKSTMLEEHFYVKLGDRHYNIRITDIGGVWVDMHERGCNRYGCDTVSIFAHNEPMYTSICRMFADWRNS
jgi:hypothetical protein